MKTITIIKLTGNLPESIKSHGEAHEQLSMTYEGVMPYSKELHDSLNRLCRKKSLFEKIYDSVSYFLFGGKRFFTKKNKSR